MKRQKTVIFLLVFILGIAAGIAVSGITGVHTGRGAKDSGAAAAGGLHDTANEIRGTEIPAGAVPLHTSPAYPQWDRSAVYVGGDRVLYGEKIYRAKWWTLGEIPGQADVWEDTLEIAGQAGTSKQPDVPGHTQDSTASAGKISEDSAGLKVVGYYPDWKGYQPEKLRFDILTHVAYAFAIPTREGGLMPLEHPETASRLIEDAHKNQVKVLLAVGGWSYNGAELEPVFVSATADSGKVKVFGDRILDMCDQYGFDGVDMDWEHPRVDGTSGKQYQELMLYLAGRLHERGKILTGAVISGVSADGNIYYDAAAHSSEVLDAVDWIHVMAYDGGDGERHSPYGFSVNCADYWTKTRGMPADKVVLGVPFYGRPGWAAYGDILAADGEAWNKDHAMVNGIDAYYNGIHTMEEKAAYAKENLGGIMIWELTQDTADREKSLLSAIGRGVGMIQ